jgi:hypothetical protein
MTLTAMEFILKMSQSNKVCEICGTLGHSKFYCKNKPFKPIKRTPIKKTTKPKKSKTERSKAKEAAWNAFSIYIRTRDCLRFTGDPAQGKCITCNKPFEFKQLQAGHFINGRGNAVLFDERLVYSQCGYCNCKPPFGLNGNLINYTLFMLSEGYSQDEIAEFQRMKGTTKVYKEYHFRELEALYNEKTKGLIEEYKKK